MAGTVAAMWEDPEVSLWWQREFTDGADSEYNDQILPLIADALAGYDRVLDIGTGEGQVARMLQAAGASVVGNDPFIAQIAEAQERAGGPQYLLAEAAAQPFADESFDAAVACLVFEHITAVDDAIAEVARVLRPGGKLFLLNHPLLQTPDSGWIDDHMVDPPEHYWRLGPYLVECHTTEEVHKDVFIEFIHRPLSRYLNSLAQNGLLLQHMDEPSPPESFLAKGPTRPGGGAIPRLLALHLIKHSTRAEEAQHSG